MPRGHPEPISDDRMRPNGGRTRHGSGELDDELDSAPANGDPGPGTCA